MGQGTVPCPTKEPINEMSNMFFELYLTKISSLQELKTLFVKIMKEVSSVVETVDYPQKNKFTTSCEWATIFTDTRSYDLAFASEDYAMELTCHIWFDIFSYQYELAVNSIMKIIGRFISILDCDCVLTLDGGRTLLVRRNGKISVNGSKSRDLPYELIGYPFVEEDLSKQYDQLHGTGDGSLSRRS